MRVLLDQHRADARGRAADRHARLGLSGLAARRLRPRGRPSGRPRSRARRSSLRRAVNEELAATVGLGLAARRRRCRARASTASSASGTARLRASTAQRTRSGTAISSAPTRAAGCSRSAATTPRASPRRSPSASEALLAALRVPVFVPGSVQEALDLGRHAIACSRASGLWSAMKVVTNVADATATAEVGAGSRRARRSRCSSGRARRTSTAPPRICSHRTRSRWSGRSSRCGSSSPSATPARTRLNRIVYDAPGARTRHRRRGRHRARGAPARSPTSRPIASSPSVCWPSGCSSRSTRTRCARSRAGSTRSLVIEEKGPFLERFVRDALYGGPATPPVLGQRDERGAPLVPAYGDGRRGRDRPHRRRRGCSPAHELADVRERLALLDAVRRASGPRARRRAHALLLLRLPPQHQHGRARRRRRRRRDRLPHDGDARRARAAATLTGLTQMGSEGAQWIGVAPFVETPHFIQNLGDGTFHHSGSLGDPRRRRRRRQRDLQAARTTATCR